MRKLVMRQSIQSFARLLVTARLRAAALGAAAPIIATVLVLLVPAGPPAAQAPDAIERGKAKFEYLCAPCHGAGIGDDGRAMLPGTDALRIKYRGELPALLTERKDLTPEAIRTFVRRGVFSMPPYRPTEITDAEIYDIAAYIEDSASKRP